MSTSKGTFHKQHFYEKELGRQPGMFLLPNWCLRINNLWKKSGSMWMMKTQLVTLGTISKKHNAKALDMQPWTNVWTTLNELEDAASNDNFKKAPLKAEYLKNY